MCPILHNQTSSNSQLIRYDVFFSGSIFYFSTDSKCECSHRLEHNLPECGSDGADAVRRISGRRLSAAAFRDPQPPRGTGCQVTRPQGLDCLTSCGRRRRRRSPAGTEAAATGLFYLQTRQQHSECSGGMITFSL